MLLRLLSWIGTLGIPALLFLMPTYIIVGQIFYCVCAVVFLLLVGVLLLVNLNDQIKEQVATKYYEKLKNDPYLVIEDKLRITVELSTVLLIMLVFPSLMPVLWFLVPKIILHSIVTYSFEGLGNFGKELDEKETLILED